MPPKGAKVAKRESKGKSKNKNYRGVPGGYECVRCGVVLPTMRAICSHSYAERKRLGVLSEWDLHRTWQCKRNSRFCRYCHPERALAGSHPHGYEPDGTLETFFKAIVPREGRYRNKFSREHLAKLDRYAPRELREAIEKALEGRVRAKPESDGKQTPYVGSPPDPIAVASHTCAACCRGCIGRWHRVPAELESAPSVLFEPWPTGGLAGAALRMATERNEVLQKTNAAIRAVAPPPYSTARDAEFAARGHVPGMHKREPQIPGATWKILDRDLTDEEVARLARVVNEYLTQMVLPPGSVRRWMTELPRTVGVDQFYLEGDYELTKEGGRWEVERVGEGYQGEMTPFKR